MSVDNFINELQDRNLLSERVLSKLREAAADPNRPLSARTLAKFLVQKKQLSDREAKDIINSLLVSGVDVDKTGPPSTIITASPRRAAKDVQPEDEEDPESSNIFASFLTKPGKNKPGAPSPDDDDELTLMPLDDDEGEPVPRDADFAKVDDDVPVLGLLVPPEEESPARPVKPDKRSRKPAPPPEPPLAATLEELREASVAADESPPDDNGESTRGRAKRLPRDRRTHKKSTLARKQWDSPLMLYGGGALALLVLVGAGIFWLLKWEKGDKELQAAKSALDAGAFSEAIEHYKTFLENSPRHPEHGKARVQLALARIRQAAEANRFSEALELAPKELEAVEDEEAFSDAHGDLASLLPQIAMGLARQAEQTRAGDENTSKLVGQAKTAIELCNNVVYIPKSVRFQGFDTQLEEVREILRRVEHREQSHQALQETLAAMDKAVHAGDGTAAFVARTRLVKERPELADNSKLAQMIQKAAAADQAAVKFIREEQAAETTDRPHPWVASLALAQRRGLMPAASGPSGPVACVRVEGAVYGIDVATGTVFWRQYVGFSPHAWPVMLGGNVLVADTRQNELLCLIAATGKLVWRQSIGESFSEPLVVGSRAFLAAKSGKLYVIDLASGARAGYMKLPQPLGPPPTVDRRQQRLYITGDQFSLYTISLADLTCLGSYFLGHEAASVQVAPAQLLNKLVVLENRGVETSRLHVLSLDDRDAVAGEETTKRLAGLAASPLLVDGRRLIAITDRGRFDVYEIGAGKGDEALVSVAARPASDRQSVVRYVAVANGHLWVGDTQLTKLAILPTGDQLPVESIQSNFAGDAFDHPLELFGDTLISVRRPKGRAGAVVAATDTKQGRMLWETDLAVPPAAAPVTDASGRTLAVANANGYMFRFDEAAIKSRVQDEALAAQSMPTSARPLTGGADLGDGRAAFFAPNSDQLLLYDPAAGNNAARWLKLPGPLACAATAFASGLVAPLKIGQVFYVDLASPELSVAPFQPKLEPRTTVEYRPAGAGAAADRRFVITDGQEKIYLLALADQPQPRLEAVAEGKVSPMRIVSLVAVVGEMAVAAAEGGHLLRYKLPSLESAGDVDLPGEVVWGPYRVGDNAVLATADQQLVGISTTGDVMWKASLEHGELAGPPLAAPDGIVFAYRNGIVERRNMADGKSIAYREVEHPLATGPTRFMRRLVVAADDGTLLVVDQP